MHTNTNKKFIYFFFLFPPEVSSHGKRRWNSLQTSVCSSLDTRAFRIEVCINPSRTSVFFANKGATPFIVLLPVKKVV